MEYKVGDILRSKLVNKEYKVSLLTEAGNVILSSDDDGEILRTSAFLDQHYAKVDPFFEVGKAYRFDLHTTKPVTFTIDKLYELDGKWAVAVAENHKGQTYLVSLSAEDFDVMDEVPLDNG